MSIKSLEPIKGKLKHVEHSAIYIDRSIGKYSTDRHIPMHSLLKSALADLLEEVEDTTGYVVPSRYATDQNVRPKAHALKMRIARLYDKLGFKECSSHSGRRTFITNAARSANLVHCSLRDVQLLAGHRHINTTEKYIGPSGNQFHLVNLT